MDRECGICLESAQVTRIEPGIWKVSCDRCKDYTTTADWSSARGLVGLEKRILSGIVRNRYEQGIPTHISSENLEAILASMAVPSDPLETIDWLLNYLWRKASQVSEYVLINRVTDYPILFAKDTSDLQYYLQKALELEYIEQDGHSYRPNTEGWRRLIDLRKEERESDQAFVAMWFEPEDSYLPYLSGAYENGFKPALEETGYKPMKMDWKEHNEKICDVIIAEIRKSGLLVADVTGHRENVYFEVGFAMGLGIPVIWTCHKTDIKKLPFDTRQYNHIVWSDSGDLKERLINRIEATLPIRPRKGQ